MPAGGLRHYQLLDQKLIKAVSASPDKRNNDAEKNLREQIVSLKAKLTKLDKEIAQQFPEYATLMSREPMPPSEAQKLLGKDEALLTFTRSWKDKGKGNYTHVFVVRSDGIHAYTVPVSLEEIKDAVASPTLSSLGEGDAAAEWRNRFLIRSDQQIAHSVFIACGKNLRSDWGMDRLGMSLKNAVPVELYDRFTKGCQRAVAASCPIPIEGQYRDEGHCNVLFRCIIMPVRSSGDEGNFIFGANSQLIAN